MASSGINIGDIRRLKEVDLSKVEYSDDWLVASFA
jgi:hypothetical protein